tara:strand:- start:983 stop:1234 length:252 start_codon:yes stop_codon:yes gene_type:complete
MSTDRDEAFSEIRKGDKVFYFNAQLQECSGKAIMVGPDGWVISCEHGPVVVNEGNNYAGHIPSKGEREDDHFGKWLNNWSTSI